MAAKYFESMSDCAVVYTMYPYSLTLGPRKERILCGEKEQPCRSHVETNTSSDNSFSVEIGRCCDVVEHVGLRSRYALAFPCGDRCDSKQASIVISAPRSPNLRFSSDGCTMFPLARRLTQTWWSMSDSNRRPPACKAGALAN